MSFFQNILAPLGRNNITVGEHFEPKHCFIGLFDDQTNLGNLFLATQSARDLPLQAAQ